MGPTRLADPAKTLPAGWQHSTDEAVTVVGDATGLHVLAASEANGYAWRTVATLGSPEVETDLWIGQACVTASGDYAVVVYAPEQVTNMAGAQGVLGRAAVVNLRTGAVRQLGGGFSVAYFDPGCGTGTDAVLTEGGWANDSSVAPAQTGLAVVNAATGTITATVRVAGQVTSAVPYDGQIAAAGGYGLEEITLTGKTRLLADAPTVPYELVPDSDGGLGYQTVVGTQVQLWRMADGAAKQVASAVKGSVELRQIGGRVWLVGPDASKVGGLPKQWQPVNAVVTAQPSTTGTLLVDTSGSIAPVKGQQYNPDTAQPVGIRTQLLSGSRNSDSFQVPTTAATIAPATPAQSTRAIKTDAAVQSDSVGSSSTPISADRTCSIPIDDPSIQAYQPNFDQVEWAADQAVQGTLTDTRPAGLYGSDLSSYTPQGMFPLPSGGIDGGGQLPAQVLLGVLTQESNLQQASVHVIQGETSNPLTSFNWYGNWTKGETDNTGLINWSASDCGYGIGQITSGMCLAEDQNNDTECEYATPLAYQQQLAIAVDYQANIAKAAQLLIDYWNDLWTDDILPDGDTADGPSSNADLIDNWYMAIWAYNSGIEPGTSEFGNTTGCTPGPSCTDGYGNWGLGYANNPINPIYPPDRPTFPGSSPNGYSAPGGATYSLDWDTSHPQYWPYQEKVLAWAYDSITLWDYNQDEYEQAFAYAHGTYTPPPYGEFCTSADNCNDSAVNDTLASAPDSCELTATYDADHCWWHFEPDSATWPITAPTTSCSDCGLSVITYGSGSTDPPTAAIASEYAQTCASTLPTTAVIVGDGGQSALGCPGQNWSSLGTLTWDFAADGNGLYSSKIDFDQIGAGFGGHFWFGYTQPNDDASASSINPASGYADQAITGTWTPPDNVTGWTTIEAAIPSYGDDAAIANYQVNPGGSLPTRNVQINQAATSGTNTWVDLGDFDLASGASVSLSNVAWGGTGVDIDWSAMAFVPTSDPGANYVAMGDSYSAGEGNAPYFPGTDTSTDTCHRSLDSSYPVKVTLPGQTAPIANQTTGSFNFIACSGAETTGVTSAAVNPPGSPNPAFNSGEIPYNAVGTTDWGYVQYATPWNSNSPPGPPEGLQVNNGALNGNTSLITINIGGNDARFGDLILNCLKAALPTNNGDCASPNFYLTRSSKNGGATDPTALSTFEPLVISWLQSHLLQTYLSINDVAPSADIVVVGYPQIFPQNPTTSCNSGTLLGTVVSLTPDVQNMINVFALDLDNVIQQAVQQARADGVDIQFINPTSAFIGHDICSGSSNTWFLPLSLTNTPGSYHPNPSGQQALADLVNQCLAGTLASCTS